jgi:hypothetical protein
MNGRDADLGFTLRLRGGVDRGPDEALALATVARFETTPPPARPRLDGWRVT